MTEQRIGDVKLTGAEHALLSVGIFDGIEIDLVESDVCAIPISGRTFDDKFLIGEPCLELERAIADEIFRPRPACAFSVESAESGDTGIGTGNQAWWHMVWSR